MVMFFRGFGSARSQMEGFGQQSAPPTMQFGGGVRSPAGVPVGPDTPAPLMGAYSPTPSQNTTAGAPGGYVPPTAPSKWAAGGGGWDAVGSIGNTLMALSGDPALVALAQQNRSQRFQQRQNQQEQLLRAQMAQQERAADNRTWIERQLWEREHPKPVNNDTAADYAFLKQQLGSEYADQYLRNFAAGPVTAVDGFDAAGNPTKTFVPRGSLGGGMMPGGGVGPDLDPVPTRPVGKLRPLQGGAPSQGGASFR